MLIFSTETFCKQLNPDDLAPILFLLVIGVWEVGKHWWGNDSWILVNNTWCTREKLCNALWFCLVIEHKMFLVILQQSSDRLWSLSSLCVLSLSSCIFLSWFCFCQCGTVLLFFFFCSASLQIRMKCHLQIWGKQETQQAGQVCLAGRGSAPFSDEPGFCSAVSF